MLPHADQSIEISSPQKAPFIPPPSQEPSNMTTTLLFSVWIDLFVLELHIHGLVLHALLLCLLWLLGVVTLGFIPAGVGVVVAYSVPCCMV